MLNDLLGVTNAINVLWTLSYEMVFYLLLTALFTVGVHRRSGRLALAFAAAAAGFLAVLLGLSSVTYYLVEAPMQRAGRGLARRLDARFGPDRLTPAGARGS